MLLKNAKYDFQKDLERYTNLTHIAPRPGGGYLYIIVDTMMNRYGWVFESKCMYMGGSLS